MHLLPLHTFLLSSSAVSSINDDKTAFILLIIFLVISVSILLYIYINKTKTIKILRSVEDMRSDVFTKITHEFRTPLTIILGLSRQLRDQKDINGNNAQSYLNAIERQGKNLSELINQLLDISNLQTIPKTLEWKTGNIVTFVEMISETFQIYAADKEIELLFFSEERIIETDFVPDYLNKILHNLINNAIKYSTPGSRINVVIRKNKKNIEIDVIDQGEGISKEVLPHIFELFYHTNTNGEKIGNGIGLALTKQLVEVLGGTIAVKSKLGKGSKFTVELPLQISEKTLYPYWIPNKTKSLKNNFNNIDSDDYDLQQQKINEDDDRITILLVEDNKDIALYISSIFTEDGYNIIYARNGERAIELANEHIPDIILTDVIMPKKNGLEFCEEVKASTILNHIPVIIISAKNSDEDVRKAFDSGADGFLKKPFPPEELKARVKTLLKMRNLLKEKYRRTIINTEKESVKSNADMKFLRHATDIIYREMKNPDFSSTKLAQELALSVSQLNKKLKAIVDYPSSTYILNIKLSHAKKLLINTNKSISDIATDCGIYDINYFSRVFKRHTGLTPTQFRRLPQNQIENN